VLGGLVAWTLAATVLNLGVRLWWPGYAAVEKQMDFTLGMMLARLVIGALATVVGGFTGAWISRGKPLATWLLAIALLALFIPLHIDLWPRFPAWYHLTFLLSLVVCTWLGGRLKRRT
jgi:hypothetical protein